MKRNDQGQAMRGGIVRRQLKDGSFVYYAPVRYRDEIGKIKQKWLGPHAKRDDADKARTAFKAQILKGQKPQPKSYTVAALMDDWLAVRSADLAPGSLARYQRDNRGHVTPLLGSKVLMSLEPADLERFKAELRKRGLGPGGTHGAYTTLTKALNWAVRIGKLQVSPHVRVSRPVYTPEKRPVINEEDAANIIELARHRWLGLGIELIINTGLRRHEVTGLRWADVDFTSGALIIRKSKSESGVRLIPVSPELITRLVAHRPVDAGLNDHVFTHMRRSDLIEGGALRPDTLDRAWKRIRDEAGYPELHLHDLRHAFATIALRNGVELVHVADLLGHKDATVTARVYAHVTGEGRREAANKVAQALQRGLESATSRKLLDGVLDSTPEK